MFHQLPEKLEAFREATAPPFRRRRREEVLVHARESCSSQFRGSHDVETPASRRTRRNPHSTSSKLAAGSSRVPPRMFARILASEFILDIKATSARCIMLTHTHIQTRAPTRTSRRRLHRHACSNRRERTDAVSSVAALDTSRNYLASGRCFTLVFVMLDCASSKRLLVNWYNFEVLRKDSFLRKLYNIDF